MIAEILPSARTGTDSAASRIVPMTPEHAAEVLAIYRLGIDEGQATFETTAPTWEQFDSAKLPGHRHVALDEAGHVLGWVADGTGLMRADAEIVAERMRSPAPRSFTSGSKGRAPGKTVRSGAEGRFQGRSSDLLPVTAATVAAIMVRQ
ncbi:GNAT family N-acetyltransferase [Sphaerisporangium siamense]|uniref:GNAT family N-acetyltransferase n=1 Tax=Sphaerisporangium siamense TaxID=795645 RepID=UPI001EF166A1|nr:hypothetical protein [Sphaerisporangium siamense]